MAFDKITFEKIRQMIKISPLYLIMRESMGGSGAFQKYSSLNDDGSVASLGELCSTSSRHNVLTRT